MKNTRWLLTAIWWLIAAATAVWSYHLVDPNLTLFSFPGFVAWQQAMWLRAQNTPVVTWQYIVLLGMWWVAYGWTLQQARKERLHRFPQWVWSVLLGVGALLLIGHNALSHDIFNYLFNAKMVAVYQANPHVSVALDFAYDPWVRFMHNVHTAAPYGWGWTALSLLPFIVSGGKFVVAYFGMKLWMGLGLGLYLFSIWKLLKYKYPQSAWSRWSMIAFHPLLLIETLLNGHNDVWMMWPVLLAMGWLCCGPRNQKWYHRVLAIGLFIFSVSIKLVTILLLPIVVWWLLPSKRTIGLWVEQHSRLVRRVWRVVQRYRADLAGMILFIPLLTPRAQQFHPWYLIWSLTFLPFGRSQLWRSIVLGLSVTSTFRYVPLMFAGWEYSPLIQSQMRFITWSGALLGIITWFVWKQLRYKK